MTGSCITGNSCFDLERVVNMSKVVTATHRVIDSTTGGAVHRCKNSGWTRRSTRCLIPASTGKRTDCSRISQEPVF